MVWFIFGLLCGGTGDISNGLGVGEWYGCGLSLAFPGPNPSCLFFHMVSVGGRGLAIEVGRVGTHFFQVATEREQGLQLRRH